MYCVRTLDACACACAFVLSVGVCGISYFSCNSPVNFNAFVFFFVLPKWNNSVQSKKYKEKNGNEKKIKRN